jgi:hypothetical protein
VPLVDLVRLYDHSPEQEEKQQPAQPGTQASGAPREPTRCRCSAIARPAAGHRCEGRRGMIHADFLRFASSDAGLSGANAKREPGVLFRETEFGIDASCDPLLEQVEP